MEFLVIVVSLLIAHRAGSLAGIQNDQLYARWIDQLRNTINPRKYPFGCLVLSLLVPVLIVVALEAAAEGVLLGLAWLALNVVLLLYAFGRSDIEKDLQTYLSALQRNDSQAAYHDAAVFNLNHHEGEAGDWDGLHREALSAISYRYFEHYFAVIFWFFLLGAPGAVLYRLSELHTDMELDNGSEKPAAQKWLWLMEWLPARLLGLTLSVVGNFSACFSRWQASLLNSQAATAEVLMGYIKGAMEGSSGSPEEQRIADVKAVKSLYSRALVLALSLVAVWVIFG